MPPKFGGGTPKCFKCEKPCYPTEKESAWERVWHKNCFRCSACNCTLTQASAYSNSTTYALYCQTHYNEMDRRSGGLASVSKDTYMKDGLAKSSIEDAKVEAKERAAPAVEAVKPSSGLGGANEMCHVCAKTVYKVEKAPYDIPCHKNCFKCKQCNVLLDSINAVFHNEVFYCKKDYHSLAGQKKHLDF